MIAGFDCLLWLLAWAACFDCLQWLFALIACFDCLLSLLILVALNTLLRVHAQVSSSKLPRDCAPADGRRTVLARSCPGFLWAPPGFLCVTLPPAVAWVSMGVVAWVAVGAAWVPMVLALLVCFACSLCLLRMLVLIACFDYLLCLLALLASCSL